MCWARAGVQNQNLAPQNDDITYQYILVLELKGQRLGFKMLGWLHAAQGLGLGLGKFGFTRCLGFNLTRQLLLATWARSFFFFFFSNFGQDYQFAQAMRLPLDMLFRQCKGLNMDFKRISIAKQSRIYFLTPLLKMETIDHTISTKDKPNKKHSQALAKRTRPECQKAG